MGKRDLLWLGVWVWGSMTALLGGFLLFTLLQAAITGEVTSSPYIVVKENAGVLGPMIAASALVWSWFFQLDFKRQQRADASEFSSDV